MKMNTSKSFLIKKKGFEFYGNLQMVNIKHF